MIEGPLANFSHAMEGGPEMSGPTVPPTLGVLVAGGLSRRMGGGDKPFKLLGSCTLLERAAGRLRPQCIELILNANGDPARFSETGLTVVPDGVPNFAGPLAGILAALDWTATHRPAIGWVVSAASDSPFLPQDFVSRLHAARLHAGAPLACARTGSRTHPVNGLWSVKLRDDLRRALIDEDMRKIDRWTARHGVAVADWTNDPFDPFFNINTPDDLAEAAQLLDRYGDA